MSLASNKKLIHLYYDRLWNGWDGSLTDKILDPNITFRGSLGNTVQGIDGFRGYMELVQRAFPDFHNHVEELIAEANTVVARVTYTGTNLGPIFGQRPTGHKVTYSGIAIFHFKRGKIFSGWVLGDQANLREQLSKPPQSARRK